MTGFRQGVLGLTIGLGVGAAVQFYSENTPIRILAWRGQVVEGFGAASKKLMGTIADREALGGLTKVSVRNIWVRKLN